MRRPSTSPQPTTARPAGRSSGQLSLSNALAAALRRPPNLVPRSQPEPKQFDACAAPSGAAQGQFLVPFRRTLIGDWRPLGAERPSNVKRDVSSVKLACVSGRMPGGITLQPGLALQFEQV